MQRVVRGSAIINPTNPNRVPQIESDKSIIAGLRPTAFPIILGTKNISWITWTTTNTSSTNIKRYQKFSPVCAECNIVSNIAGTKPTVCKYGTRLRNPIKNPKRTAKGKPTIENPIAKRLKKSLYENYSENGHDITTNDTNLCLKLLRI